MSNSLWRLIRRVLFTQDAEWVHERTLSLLSRIGKCKSAPALERYLTGASSHFPFRHSVAGIEFRGKLGLAAGFDKNADAIEALSYLGFDFVEVGTVTPLPQPGNPKPRLFRIPAQQAIFNRMGFNSKGAEYVAKRLVAARTRLPSDFRVGVNIGKNKDTPLETAHDDYARAASCFEGLADFLVINISSPNTPDLRLLQNIDSIRTIVSKIQDVTGNWTRFAPIFLKLAPEIGDEALRELLDAGDRLGVSGWVLTNTLLGTYQMPDQSTLTGGWSGLPLSKISLDRLKMARSLTRASVISVGGILSVDDAMERLENGADLIEIYSGWILNGPRFPFEIAQKTRKP